MPFKFAKIRLSKEIQSIELLRGLASSMVVYFHLTYGNIRFLPANSLVKKIGFMGWSGVEIFFVISGFVIPYSMYVKNYTPGDFLVFLKKRIIRIEPPYLLSILLVLLLNYLSTLSPFYRGLPFTIDWINLASHIAYLNIFTGGVWLNPVYWSLAVEFQYYLLIALGFGMIIHVKSFYRILFILLFAATSFIPLPGTQFIFLYAGYFILGILLFQYLCKIIGQTEFFLLLAITIAVLFTKHGMLLSLLGLTTILMIAYIEEVPSFFRYLGLVSYSLYLIHVPIAGRIINISEVLVQNVFARECIVFAAFVISVVASAFFYKYIELTFKKFSAAIKYNHKSVKPNFPVAE